MSDIPQWRRRVHHVRSRQSITGQVQEVEKSDAMSTAATISFPAQSDSESRPRMSRLAYYLSTHRLPGSSEKIESPSFEWAISKNKDRVYDPDLEAMCNAVKMRVLTYPVQDLPALYNSFVLHILEDYQRLLGEQHTLKETLDTKIESHRTELLNFGRTIDAWDTERGQVRFSPRLSLNINHNTAESRDDGAGLNKMQSKDRHWPTSPSRGMTRLSRQLMKARSGPEIRLATASPIKNRPRKGPWFSKSTSPPLESKEEHPESTSESDLSSGEGDLLPDEQEELSKQSEEGNDGKVAHLTTWLADPSHPTPHGRTGVRSARIGSATMLASRIVSDLPALNGSYHEMAISGNSRNRITNVVRYDESLIVPKAGTYRNGHRRGFSFVPGDDTKEARLEVARPDSITAGNDNTKETPSSQPVQHSSNDGQGEGYRVGYPVRGDTAPLRSAMGEPQRDNSNRSVLTVINIASCANSASINRANSDSSGTVINQGRRAANKGLSLAAAAARAASKGGH